MADSKENKQFDSWEEVILDFFNSKRNTEEEKYLKNIIKTIGNEFKKRNFFDDEKIEFIFDSKKNKKNKDESSLSFQRNRARQIMCLKKDHPDVIEYRKVRGDYFQKVRVINDKYVPKQWLSKNCDNASSVSFATHVAKLTHSKIDTPSLFDEVNDMKHGLLTTSSLTNKVIDGAVAGNQFAPIFQFLELELNGKKLAERLTEDNQIFSVFEDEKNSADHWMDGFRASLKSKSLATHHLSKQVYFPVENDYHLLSNMISSSLAHHIFESVFDDGQKPVKAAFNKNKYHEFIRIRYTHRSQLSVTASNHSNASQLNGRRGGKLHLLSNQPPTWKTQLEPPTYKKSLFNNLYNSNIKIEIDYMRDFLIRFKNLELSIKDPKRKHHLERWVNNIIDEFLFYVGSIQNLSAGWSDTENIKLKLAHQYLLDPYRTDDAFQSARQGTDWQSIIQTDFANWLNYQLRGKNEQFTPQAEHTRLWKKLLETPLREYMEPIEIEVKQQRKEAV